MKLNFTKKLLYRIRLSAVLACFSITSSFAGNPALSSNVNNEAAGATLMQAEQKLKGTVTDDSDNPLPGVSVLIKGSTVGTITDIDGNYSIKIPDEDAVLVFSFIGYATQEVAVNSRTSININMEEDVARLDEVVVTGYMTQKKADLTGSIASVSSEEIEKNSYANVMQGLQGRLPGVHITSDGGPGGRTNIQIRGLTSIERAAPPLVVIDGLPTNVNLRDINPNDIASLQVLKDAASASIYGSRAASGVILIETKKGKAGETKITYNGSVGVSSFMNRTEMMNTQQYGQTLWQATVNDGQDLDEILIYDYEWHRDENGLPVLDKVSPIEWLNRDQTMPSADTDWFEEISQLGLQNNHQLTLSNGTDKAKTLFSLNYYENQGTQIHTMFQRYSMRLNSEYSLIEDRLTVGENISLSNIKANERNLARAALTMPPIIPVHTNDGGWGGTAMELSMDDYWNPVRILTMEKDNNRHFNKAVGNIYANLRLFKNLHLKTSYGIDYTAGNFRHIDFSYVEGGGKRDPNNGIRSERFHNLTRTWTNTLNYGLELGNHKLDLLAGMETVQFETENLGGYRRDIELEDYDYAYLKAATGNQEAYGTGDEWTLLSYFSKFNYVYDAKYLLSATLRYDGSSKFGINNRFGFFPAVSGGWRLSEENFLKDNSIIYDLKLRASWGVNGNSDIPTNALVNYYDAAYHSGLHGTSYGIKGNETGTLESGYRKVHTGNPNIRWESTTQTDIGLDFSLFNGSLSGSFDYFHKFTDGMLYEPPYLAAIGEAGHRWINAANMTNTGVELVLSYFSKPVGDFSYSITGNISSYRNKIDDLPESVKYTYGGNGLDDHILGRPLHSIYGFIADGLFKSQDEVDNSAEQPGKGLGRIRYKDLNNDGRITYQHDQTWIGVRDPDFMYGMNFKAEYKNFDFSMFWQGIAGNTVINNWKTYSDFWNVHVQTGFNHPTRLLDAWSPANPDSDIPAVSLANPNDELRTSTYFTESGSYLKLRHIEIGYNIPRNIMSIIGLQNARIYANAQNIVSLHKWWGADAYTGLDPETPSASAYVRPQMFFTGINVTF